MNKTHVLDSPRRARQYANLQLYCTLRARSRVDGGSDGGLDEDGGSDHRSHFLPVSRKKKILIDCTYSIKNKSS
jgi:hypothetical protein